MNAYTLINKRNSIVEQGGPLSRSGSSFIRWNMRGWTAARFIVVLAITLVASMGCGSLPVVDDDVLPMDDDMMSMDDGMNAETTDSDSAESGDVAEQAALFRGGFRGIDLPAGREDWLNRFFAQPKAPTEFTVVSAQEIHPDVGLQVVLRFRNNAEDVDRFIVERSLDGPNGNYAVFHNLPNSLDSDPELDPRFGDHRIHTIGYAEPQTEYCYRVRVRNERGTSEPSVVGCTTTPTTCVTDVDCGPTEFCWFTSGHCDATSADGVCKRAPQQCGGAFDPVCGCDGTTYPSRCHAEMVRSSVAHAGSCPVTFDFDLTTTDWIVSGQDGSDWTGSELVFTSQELGNTGLVLEGYFDWKSNGEFRGRELFAGTLSEDLDLQIEGYQLVNADNIALATYQARVSASGDLISNGTWSGPSAALGSWSAAPAQLCDSDSDCNDGNPCTIDACDTNQMCTSLPGGCVEDDDAFEPNDSIATATNIEPGTYSLQGWNDDWFRIELAGQGTLNIAVSGWEGDLDLRLFAAPNTLNAVAVSETPTSNEQLSLQVDAGAYYVKVYPWWNPNTQEAIGSPYVLDIAFTQQQVPAQGDRGTVMVSSTTSNVLPIGTHHVSESDDTIIALFDNEGNRVLENEPGSSQYNYPFDDANNDGNVVAGNAYSGGANIVIRADLGGGTDFVALHLQVWQEYAGGPIHYYPVRLLAGDAGFGGVVMSADGPIPGDPGQITGFELYEDSGFPFLHGKVTAVPRFASLDPFNPVLYSNGIEFEFEVTLYND